MSYSIGINIEGFNMVDIAEDATKALKDENVIMRLGEESNDRLYDYYTGVKDLIKGRNRVVLLMDGDSSMIRKQICMLMISYGCFDIYKMNSDTQVTVSYIESLLGRQSCEEEIEQFIGADVSVYSEINSLMLKITEKVELDNIDELAELVYESKDLIINAVSVIDYMKKVVDRAHSGVNTKVAKLQEEVAQANRDLDRYSIKMSSKENELKRALEEAVGLKKETNTAKQKCLDLEDQMNKAGSVVKIYSPLNTSAIKCRTTVILYFKEISKINYINSLVMRIFKTITDANQLKVKLLIYDNACSFNVYTPIDVVDGTNYTNNRDSIVTKSDKIVIVEPNQGLLEDILTVGYDVVIIYDRLRNINDLVKGNCVSKYYVANSNSDIKSLTSATSGGVDLNRIISSVGTNADCLSIPNIPGYKAKSDSNKFVAYLGLLNGGKSGGKLIEGILSKANIDKISDSR